MAVAVVEAEAEAEAVTAAVVVVACRPIEHVLQAKPPALEEVSWIRLLSLEVDRTKARRLSTVPRSHLRNNSTSGQNLGPDMGPEAGCTTAMLFPAATGGATGSSFLAEPEHSSATKSENHR